MDSCIPRMLVNKERFYIAQCKKCHRIGLTYNNILAGFDVDEFIKFSKEVLILDFDRHSMPFPDGKDHIVVHTCHQDIQFTFNAKEFKHLAEGCSEALLMLEVNAILH